MKQVTILYEKCKKKIPNRPPDEIDFGLGFRAALDWTLSGEMKYVDCWGQRRIDEERVEQELQ